MTAARPLCDDTRRHPSQRWSGAEYPGMLDALGFPPGGPARRHEGKTVLHELRITDRADAATVRRTATWLRDDPARARRAGMACDEDVTALAVLLDLLATQLPHLDAAVRREVVEVCRAALG